MGALAVTKTEERYKHPPGTKFSRIRGYLIYSDEVSARGTPNRTVSAGSDIPVWKPTHRPRNWQERLLDDARCHKDKEIRRVSRAQLVGHCEELIGPFVARRRITDIEGMIGQIAKIMVEEAIYPSVRYTPAKLSEQLGIAQKTFFKKRSNGCCWKTDIEYIRDNWLDRFRRGIEL